MAVKVEECGPLQVRSVILAADKVSKLARYRPPVWPQVFEAREIIECEFFVAQEMVGGTVFMGPCGLEGAKPALVAYISLGYHGLTVSLPPPSLSA